MLSIYARQNGQLVQKDWSAEGLPEGLVWLDLLNPTADDDRLVEQHVGISVPTRAEMEEIELSARLYNESGAQFMTLTAIIGLDTDEPERAPITFIIKGKVLVMVRFAEPKPFLAYTTRAARRDDVACETGELVMLGLIEALIPVTGGARSYALSMNGSAFAGGQSLSFPHR